MYKKGYASRVLIMKILADFQAFQVPLGLKITSSILNHPQSLLGSKASNEVR